jgi:hypothetical protein
MARSYKWQVPLKALTQLGEETGRSWFSSAEVSERAESLCRWEVSQRAVAVAMRKWMRQGVVEGRKVRQQTFSQAHVEIWEWKVI